LRCMMQSVAKKTDFDNDKVNRLSYQSSVFQREFKDIQNDYQEHFEAMRRQTASYVNRLALLQPGSPSSPERQSPQTPRGVEQDERAVSFRSYEETKKAWSEEHSINSGSLNSSDSESIGYQQALTNSNNWELRSKDIRI